MKKHLFWGLFFALACSTIPKANTPTPLRILHKNPVTPIIIGHRGASGYLPEHTLAAYSIAILQGADYIEPDLVMTKDGILIARHENEISQTTNVSEIPEFLDRKTTKTIDGVSSEGWFTEDFTLAELKTLRARERLPTLRLANTRFDNHFEVPTLQEILEFVQVMEQVRGKQNGTRSHRIGLYIEIKHSSYFQNLSLPMEEALIKILEKYGYQKKEDPVFIQSFEVGNLQKLRQMTSLPLVQLIHNEGNPYDFIAENDQRTYRDLITPEGLGTIANYADGIGVHKGLILSAELDATPSTLIKDAHQKGLVVHAWTFRAENRFLGKRFQQGDKPEISGNLLEEINTFLSLGLDGVFTDFPDIGVKAKKLFLQQKALSSSE